jgi:hypothetical protein
MNQKTYSLWIVDRANQISQRDYSTASEADTAYDFYESGGNDVYTERLAACLARDAYAKRQERQRQRVA